MSLEEKLKTLTREEAIALYWTCRGYRYGEIGDQKLHVTYGRVQQHMSKVYEKLGYEGDDNSAAHRKFLTENKVRETLNALIDNNIDVLETFPLTPKEENVEVLPPEVVEPPETPPPSPVSEPITEPVSTPTEAPINDVSSPRGNRTLLWILLGFLVLLVAFGYTAYYFYNLGQSLPTPTIPAGPQNTPISSSLPTQELPTLTPTSPLLPTNTPTIAITDTPLPTSTPKPYISEGEVLELKPGVIAFMDSRFAPRGGQCEKVFRDFGLEDNRKK